jgi:TonB family protein
MRKVILATLALSPILLHAQANSPTQPQSGNTALLAANPTQSTEIASAAESSSTSSPTDARFFTGIVKPKLIYSIDVPTNGDLVSTLPNFERIAIVQMIVDEKGKPSELKITKSVGTAMDRNVLAAVSQYRFKPGTLDNQPTAVPVELEVIMHNNIQ